MALRWLEKCREQKRNIQFIIISGYSQFEYTRQALAIWSKGLSFKAGHEGRDGGGFKECRQMSWIHWKEKISRKRDLNDPLSGELKRIRKGMDGYSLVVSGALKRIEHDIDKNISLGDMAGEFLISPSHFSKCFKRETGVGFTSYVTMVKWRRQEHC